MNGCDNRQNSNVPGSQLLVMFFFWLCFPLLTANAQTETEFGTNDFRISFVATDGDNTFNASNSATAYNSNNQEYLVIWQADTDEGALVDGKFEIYGQRVNALTGALNGSPFRITRTGIDSDATNTARDPALAYNSDTNQFIVIWVAPVNSDPNDIEIQGQLINANGTLSGGAFVISNMGDHITQPAAKEPAVLYNPTEDHFFVLWSGAKDVADKFEIYGRRIQTDGTPIDIDDIRISTMGPGGDTAYEAKAPAVAYSSKDNYYLVVWAGDTNENLQVDDEFEIFAQRINASDGTESGTSDIRISDMGGIGNTTFQANAPAVAYDSNTDQFLVVWEGTDDAGSDTSQEIYGQFLSGSDTTEIGLNDQLLSKMGPPNDSNFTAQTPAVVFNATENEFLIVWSGDDDSLADDEFEIYGQRVAGGTIRAPIGNNNFRLSDAGVDNDPTSDALLPAVAFNNQHNTYLIVWQADDTAAGTVDDEFEIFGQLLALRGADLALSGSVSPDPVIARNDLTFNLTASNNGPDDSGTVTVSSSISDGLVLRSYSGSGWSCFTTAGVISCELATLANGDSSAVMLVFDTAALMTSPISNTFDVSAVDAFDPDSGNDAITLNTSITVACSGKKPKVRKRGNRAIIILPKRLVTGLVQGLTVTASRISPPGRTRTKQKPPRRRVRFKNLQEGLWRFSYEATLFDMNTCTGGSRRVRF